MPPVWWGRPLAEMRWQAEFLRLLADPIYLGGGRPRGDGRPVVLVPGFAGGDWTLSHLAFWLGRTGYRPVTCRIERAAPPRVSPSSLVSTTPVKSRRSLKALAVFTAS